MNIIRMLSEIMSCRIFRSDRKHSDSLHLGRVVQFVECYDITGQQTVGSLFEHLS